MSELASHPNDARYNMKVVNCHYQMRYNGRINLEKLEKKLPDSKFYRGRPKMLTCLLTEKRRRVQFFSSGTIQIMGNNYKKEEILQEVYTLVCRLLSEIAYPTATVTVTPPKVTNIVVKFDLKHNYKFRDCVSNKNFSYEPEIFPAALISYWRPSHITLFANGRGMITGIKTELQAQKIISSIDDFFSAHKHASLRGQ